MKTKNLSIIPFLVSHGLAMLFLVGGTQAAVQPSESSLFDIQHGNGPKTNGDLQSTAQVVGYVTVGGQRHHALFTVFGQSPTYGMDLVVFDIDTKGLLKRFQIPDVAGSAALAFSGDQLYFATVDKPKLYRYDTTNIDAPPVLLAEIPFFASDSAKGNGYAFGTIIGPDPTQAKQMRDGMAISTSTFKAVYLTGTYTGHLYRYTDLIGLEDLGKINPVEQYGRFTRRWKHCLAIGTGVVNPSITLYDIAAGSFLKDSAGNVLHAVPPALVGRTDLEYARPSRKRYTTESDPYLYVTFDGQPGATYRLDVSGVAAGQSPSQYWSGPLTTPPSIGTDLFYPEVTSGISVARVLRDPPTQIDYLEINYIRGASLESLGYEGGPVRFAATTNKEDEMYFSSYLPGYLYGGNLATGEFTKRYPYSIGGESYSLLIRNLKNGKHVLFSGNYSGSSPLGLTDLADPSKIQNIVFGSDIRNDWRPHAMVEDSKGMIFMGAQPGYGQRNGYVVRFDPESTLTQNGNFYSYADYHILTLLNQSPTCLLPYGPFEVGGTMIQTGAGTDPDPTSSAQLFLYCGQDAGACVGKRDTIVNTVNLKGLLNRDKPAESLSVIKVVSIAPLGNGQFTAAVQYPTQTGFLNFTLDASDPTHPTIKIAETAVLPTFPSNPLSEFWNPSVFAPTQGILYAVSTSRIYLVSLNGSRLTYTPVFNTAYHRIDIGGLLYDNAALFYSSLDNIFKLGPIPTGPMISTPTITATFTSATLSWASASGTNGTVHYEIERKPGGSNGPFVLIASTNSTTFRDTGLTMGTAYDYRLRIVDEGALKTPLGLFDLRSAYSATISAQTLSLPPFTDNFDAEPSGMAPSRWTTYSNNGTSVAVDDLLHRGLAGKSVHLLDQSSTEFAQIQRTNSPMDTVYYKASVRFKRTDQLNYVLLGNGNKSSLFFIFAYNGQWSRSDGTKTTRLPGDTVGYEANRWYDVEVEADFLKGTYGVWVDGVSIGQEIPISGVGNTCMTGFRITPAGTPGTGEMWVDDVYYSPARPALDLIAPRISEMRAQEVTDHSATILWSTNEDSDSRVRWGTTDQVSSGTATDTGFVTSHRMVLGPLDRSTTYYYQVESMDKSGNLRTSGVQTLVTPYDTTPPTVVVTTPTAGIVVSVPGPVKVGATANDLSGVSNVQFLLDGVVVSTATAAPYETSWWARSVANGTHTWVARAFDTVGNSGDSAPVAIKVNIPALPAAYADDFNSDTTGALPLGWTCVTGPTASVAVDETVYRGATGKSIYLQDSSSTTFAQIQHTNSPMDTVYYKASVRFKRTDQLNYFLLGNGNKSSLFFIFAYNGQWSRSDGTKTTRLPGDTVGYAANRWYDVEVEADFVKGTYGVWVDGLSIGQEIPISGVGNTCMTGFRITPAGTPGTGEMWVDDIYFAPQRPLILAATPTTDLQNPPGQSPSDEIRAYPNPCKISLGESGITIDGLGEGYSVKIFTISGQRVKTISAPPSGKSIWDLSNDNGRTVASGVYFALVEGSGTHKRLKLVVQR